MALGLSTALALAIRSRVCFHWARPLPTALRCLGEARSATQAGEELGGTQQLMAGARWRFLDDTQLASRHQEQIEEVQEVPPAPSVSAETGQRAQPLIGLLNSLQVSMGRGSLRRCFGQLGSRSSGPRAMEGDRA